MTIPRIETLFTVKDALGKIDAFDPDQRERAIVGAILEGYVRTQVRRQFDLSAEELPKLGKVLL